MNPRTWKWLAFALAMSAVCLPAQTQLAITSLSPVVRAVNSTSFPLAITGSGFCSGASVFFGQAQLFPTSTNQSTTTITVTIPFTLLTVPQQVQVYVSNVSSVCEFGTSNSLPFTI